MIPYFKTRQLLAKNGLSPELPPEERTVRGTLVTGLSKNDVALLDIFEGNVSHPDIRGYLTLMLSL